MKKTETRAVGRMRKRKRERGRPEIVAEQAAAYGVSLPADPTASERFLSPNEIGKILSITGEAVKQWIYHRRLPAVKLANGYWKVKVADFEAFLKARYEVARRRIIVTDTKNGDLPEVTEAIERLGHNGVVAHNYADALLKALDHQPALFVINLSLGTVDPWKLAEKIRATKALRNVPVLFLADSDLSDHEAERALGLAVQGFLKRPVDKHILESEIKRILERTM
jgi:CheY-like chemotaxis protein